MEGSKVNWGKVMPRRCGLSFVVSLLDFHVAYTNAQISVAEKLGINYSEEYQILSEECGWRAWKESGLDIRNVWMCRKSNLRVGRSNQTGLRFYKIHTQKEKGHACMTRLLPFNIRNRHFMYALRSPWFFIRQGITKRQMVKR